MCSRVSPLDIKIANLTLDPSVCVHLYTFLYVLSWVGSALLAGILLSWPFSWAASAGGVCSWLPESLGAASSPVSWRSQVRARNPHSWGEKPFWILWCFYQKWAFTGHVCWMPLLFQWPRCSTLCWTYRAGETRCARQLLVGNETLPHQLLTTWRNAQFWTEAPTEFRGLRVWVEIVSRHSK